MHVSWENLTRWVQTCHSSSCEKYNCVTFLLSESTILLLILSILSDSTIGRGWDYWGPQGRISGSPSFRYLSGKVEQTGKVGLFCTFHFLIQMQNVFLWGIRFLWIVAFCISEEKVCNVYLYFQLLFCVMSVQNVMEKRENILFGWVASFQELAQVSVRHPDAEAGKTKQKIDQGMFYLYIGFTLACVFVLLLFFLNTLLCLKNSWSLPTPFFPDQISLSRRQRKAWYAIRKLSFPFT